MSKLNRTLCSWCKDKKTCPQRKRIEKIFNGIDKLIGDEKPSYLIITKDCAYHKSVYYDSGYSGDLETDRMF